MKSLGYRFLRGVVSTAVTVFVLDNTGSPYYALASALLPVLGKGIRLVWPSTSEWLPF